MKYFSDILIDFWARAQTKFRNSWGNGRGIEGLTSKYFDKK